MSIYVPNFIEFCQVNQPMLLYPLFLGLYQIISKGLAPFNVKIKHWVEGQHEVWSIIETQAKEIKQPIIWVHCASYGEFEQGLPIIESLKKEYPAHQIWLTFFSPSGYLHRKNDTTVNFVSYLPLDGRKNAQRFLQTIQPSLIVFIKYEFWYYYLAEAKRLSIPTLLMSAIFRKDQLFFKWYGGFYKKMLHLFTFVLVQDENSKKLIIPIIGEEKITITGDTRFDRVLQTTQQTVSFDWLHKLNASKIIIAGSTWEKDHEIIAAASKELNNYNWIIVPHHVDAASIEECKTALPHATTLTELLHTHQTFNNPKIIIVDQIGLLRSLYQYAYISYVGGGFGKEGIHNILEPAAFGHPVIWGPHFEKFPEASGLLKMGGGYSIFDSASFLNTIQVLNKNPEQYERASQNASQFIQQNAGATLKTIQWIQEKQLLFP